MIDRQGVSLEEGKGKKVLCLWKMDEQHELVTVVGTVIFG